MKLKAQISNTSCRTIPLNVRGTKGVMAVCWPLLQSSALSPRYSAAHHCSRALSRER